MDQKINETLNQPAGMLRAYEKALFILTMLLCELRLFIGAYLYILGDKSLLFRIEIRTGEFVALCVFAFLVIAFFKVPHTAQQAKTILRKFSTYEYAFLFFLPFWYLLICFLRQNAANNNNLFRNNEWWIYITFITSLVFFPLAEFTGIARAKKVINSMLKVILLPNMVFMAWILWQWFHNIPVRFPSGNMLSELGSFSLAVGENRLHTANRALTMLFICLYLVAGNKGWKRVLYGIGSLEYLTVMLLTNNRGSFYSTMAVGALLAFVMVWHKYEEKKRLFRLLVGLLSAAMCVLCLRTLREVLFLLAERALQHNLMIDTLAQTATTGAGQILPRAMNLSTTMGRPLQSAATVLNENNSVGQVETVIHTLSDGMSNREPIYRASIYAMFRDWQHFLFGVTHYEVGDALTEFIGIKQSYSGAHNFFLQMGVAFGVPVMFLSVAFVALLVIRSWRILFRKEELFLGARMVPTVILPLLLADMFDTTLTAGNTFPCAVFYLFAGWTVAVDRCSLTKERCRDGIRAIVFTVELACLAALSWRLYPRYITLNSSGAKMLIALMIILQLCAFWLFGRLLMALLGGQRPKLQYTLPAGLATLLFMLSLGIANGHITRVTEQLAETLDQERPAIEIIQRTASCKLYVDHLPEVYYRYFGGDWHTVLHSDDLRPRQNVVLITDADQEYPNLIGRGFLYTEISDQEAVYTNSPEASKKLETAGYHLTGFFSRDLIVEPNKTLSLNSGVYRATYELRLIPSKDGTTPDPDETAVKLEVVVQGEVEPIAFRDVWFSEFDEDGFYNAVLDFKLSKTEEVNFLAELACPQDNFLLQLESVHCRKNPAFDTHSVYNSEGRCISESYFTLEGEVYTHEDGSQGKEFDYDAAGNRNVIRYLNADGALILNKSGFAEARRVFNGARQLVRDEFYGLDGQRIVCSDGVSAVDYEYDLKGNRNLERYYDLADKPVLNTSGFAERHRSYNQQKKIIREEYYDVDGQPKNISIGYAALQREYDKQGNLLLTEYFNAKGEHVACGSSNFHAYLKTLAEKKDTGACIFISIRDDGTNALTECLLADLKKLELQADLSGKYRYSYCAVIAPENVQEKQNADQPVSISGIFDGLEYSVTSAGWYAGSFCSIVFNGTEYAKNYRGMNIVVVENGVVTDSVAFDTFSQEMVMIR